MCHAWALINLIQVWMLGNFAGSGFWRLQYIGIHASSINVACSDSIACCSSVCSALSICPLLVPYWIEFHVVCATTISEFKFFALNAQIKKMLLWMMSEDAVWPLCWHLIQLWRCPILAWSGLWHRQKKHDVQRSFITLLSRCCLSLFELWRLLFLLCCERRAVEASKAHLVRACCVNAINK